MFIILLLFIQLNKCSFIEHINILISNLFWVNLGSSKKYTVVIFKQ